MKQFFAIPLWVCGSAGFFLCFLLGLNWTNVLDLFRPSAQICPAIEYLPDTIGLISCARGGAGSSYSFKARLRRNDFDSFIRTHNSNHSNSRLEPKSHGTENYRVAVNNSEFGFFLAKWRDDLLVYSYHEK
ncbi:hypothetical protein [Epibacterium ulvae]|uniref:hypothetical protein n=1 Tax=Epibacterium ulvae TaxID=1156985 RepID=UPI0024927CC8|nr:hypothetical protein [Epibacterium ulvae]